MRKIVKYCSICEEGFAEKSTFCPNCSAVLTAYQLEPVKNKAPESLSSHQLANSSLKHESIEVRHNDFLNAENELTATKSYDGAYHIALIENNDNLIRNYLLLGVFVFILFGAFSGILISIFTSALNVGVINENNVLAALTTQDPDAIDDNQEPLAKKKEKGKGGGGGGDDESDPASKGRDARMLENPLIAPNVKVKPLSNPDIKLEPAVKGPQTDYKEDKTQPYGIKNSTFTIPSNGPGSNDGQGSGANRGQGPGFGPGIGPGSDGGRDGGDKGGVGPNDGSEIGGKKIDEPLPPEKQKITAAMEILSKPKAIYTDVARQNAVQGTVTLRVTFLANANIGNITIISGLPDGLTEQAISAARSIKFVPQKVNGKAQTVTRQIQYTFTLF